MYRLPFNVYDGKVTRQCTYEDLWLINEFMLPYKVYSKHREWYLMRKEIGPEVLVVIYACLKAFRDVETVLPYNYVGAVTYVDRSRIGVVKCKELHLWKDNKLAKLMMAME